MKNKKPLDPVFPIKYALVAGGISLVLSIACIFISQQLLIRGFPKWLIWLPLIPYGIYAISAFIVTGIFAVRYMKEPERKPMPRKMVEFKDDETADYIETRHTEWIGDDTKIGECHADR